MLSADGPARQPGLDVPGEHLQDLQEGQVGITQPGVGVAAPPGHEQPPMGLHRPAGELLHEHCLAAPRLADDEAHPPLSGQGRFQPAAQLGQLALSGDEEGPRHFSRLLHRGEDRRRLWKKLGGPCCDQLVLADALVERDGFRRWLHPQFLPQGATAGLVLGQGGGPLVGEREQTHDLAVALLVQGLQLHPSLGVSQRLAMFATLPTMRGQGAQGLHSQAAVALSPDQQPLLELGAVAQGKAC